VSEQQNWAVATLEDGCRLAGMPELDGAHVCASSLPALDRAVRQVGALAAHGGDDRWYVVSCSTGIDSDTSAGGGLGVGGGYCLILVTPFASSLAISRQPATEILQAAFETHHDVGVDGRLPVRVTALRLGAGLIRLCDAQRCVQQLVGVG
jgi:hypothetical protein